MGLQIQWDRDGGPSKLLQLISNFFFCVYFLSDEK